MGWKTRIAAIGAALAVCLGFVAKQADWVDNIVPYVGRLDGPIQTWSDDADLFPRANASLTLPDVLQTTEVLAPCGDILLATAGVDDEHAARDALSVLGDLQGAAGRGHPDLLDEALDERWASLQSQLEWASDDEAYRIDYELWLIALVDEAIQAKACRDALMAFGQ